MIGMKLLLFCVLQSALGVGGTALLTQALHGRDISVASITSATMTWQGIGGLVLLFSSFLVMGVILSFAKMAAYIPLNTALTFLFTVVLTIVVQRDAVSWPLVGGMALIFVGVLLVSAATTPRP
ncbi:MAG: hypothetical protein BGO89_01690 [Candidatus Kapaibacterium thiocyanatum]|uniref:EamA domain-containing protein n=1 Tax=Candidatus Kapaibacterium thiocyanatum TaxID=1895771 RepID=A0A1M3L6W2_9BACT|nr:MAG: hypothetical protein BGO89_01690 ['Candidatus Kapabacteria' thiocyanatum]